MSTVSRPPHPVRRSVFFLATVPGLLKLPFSFFLAVRYLKPERTFISIITLISVLGVTLGVTVLILVVSVMSGFDWELRQKIVSFDAHILVTTDGVLYNWQDLATKIEKTPGVVATAPYIEGPVIVEFQNRRLAPMIRGIDLLHEGKITQLRKFIKKGELNLQGESTVLGMQLARNLRVEIGDTLTVYSTGNLAQVLDDINEVEKRGLNDRKLVDRLREVALPRELKVTGIYETGHYVYDAEFLLVSIQVGQRLYGLGHAVHGIEVETEDPYGADRVKKAIAKFLQPPEYAQTWIDMNRRIFEAIRLERTVMFFLLFFIILVASFGIMNTLITVTVRKTRDIGTMKAIGATTWQIVWIFMGQGMIVGGVGTLCGLCLGMLLVGYRNEFSHWLADTFHIKIFPEQVYEFSEIPAVVKPEEIAIICVAAFVTCWIFALIPAYRASRLDPAEALRRE